MHCQVKSKNHIFLEENIPAYNINRLPPSNTCILHKSTKIKGRTFFYVSIEEGKEQKRN